MIGGDGGTAKPGREWTRGTRVFGRPRVRHRIARTQHATESFMPVLGFRWMRASGAARSSGVVMKEEAGLRTMASRE